MWYNPYHSFYRGNPDSWETSIRKLLYEMTQEGWRVGHSPPTQWHQPYLSSRPEWSPIWLVASAFNTTPEELLSKIKPGRRRIRDIDELNVLYDFIKEHLCEHGSIRGKDVAALAAQLGLSSLSGTDTTSAGERTLLLKQLVRDGFAEQVMGRFKGSSRYISTAKLIEDKKSCKRDVSSASHAALPVGPVLSPPLAVPAEQDKTQELLDHINKLTVLSVVDDPEPEHDVEPKSKTLRKRPKQKGISKGGDPMKQIMQLVKLHKAAVRHLKKHISISFPGNKAGSARKSFTIAGTPSDRRSLNNSLGEIRRYLRSINLADRRNPDVSTEHRLLLRAQGFIITTTNQDEIEELRAAGAIFDQGQWLVPTQEIYKQLTSKHKSRKPRRRNPYLQSLRERMRLALDS